MGIVQRQSIKNSIVNYLGIIIGGLSTLFIYPLDWDLYGNIQFVLSTALLLNAFLSLGNHSLVNKYFPYFKNEGIKGFLSLLFIQAVVNIVLVSAVIYVFQNQITDLLILGGFDLEKITQNLFIIVPISFAIVFINILRAQSFNFGQIVYPDLITNFSLKLVVPLLILGSYFSILNYTTAGWLLTAYHFVIVLLLILYVKTLGGLDFKRGVLRKISVKKHIEMIRYMLYNALNHVGNILVYKIDIVMIGLLLSATKVGYYSIFLFLSVVIEIPTKAVFQITAPMISEAMENKEYNRINRIYKDASANLFIIGVALFFIIWFNINTVFTVMTNGGDLVIYKTIFLLLALTKLIDMITSVNFHIISYSKYFRVNTLFIVILAVMNIILNYIFIGKFDILGAAISTTISMFIFNLLKTVFVAIKYRMQPLNSQLFIVFLFLVISIALPYLIPALFESIIASAILTIAFSILFIFVVYKLKMTKEIIQMVDKYILKYLR